jgi:hypothetical protein
MREKPQQYTSFLLRIWRRNEAGAARWLVTLEDTGSGERHVFEQLADAYAFLATQTGAGDVTVELREED